jgi:hypothetical protein
MNVVLGHIATDVAAQEPSSEDGTTARTAAIAEVSAWQKANEREIHGLHVWIAGHRKRARGIFNRAGKVMKTETYPAGRRAVAAFKAAGFTSKRGALSK